MKFILFICLSISITFLNFQCHSNADLSGIIAEVGKRYVPDRREVFFSVVTENTVSGMILKGVKLSDHPWY
jgi:hypothetical protein